MFKGIDQDEKTKEDDNASISDSLETTNLDLLNLRLAVNRKKFETGSGDSGYKLSSEFYRRIGTLEPNPRNQPQGYESYKAHSANRIVDSFLKKRKPQHYLLKQLCTPSQEHLDQKSSKLKTHQSLVRQLHCIASDNTDETTAELKKFSDMAEKKMAAANSMTNDFSKDSAMEAILRHPALSDVNAIIGPSPVRDTQKVNKEYETKQTSEILDPELNLSRLGYTGNEPIDWNRVGLPEKKDLYLELCKRITNKRNADCKVTIGRDEFNCHLIVLQCYSELFDGYIAIKKVEIPKDKCSAESFEYIYNWMISEEQYSKYLRRENVLDIFNSAKYLKIKDLVEQCWAFIDNIEVFNEDTAFLLYVDSKNKGLEEVCELMLPRIQDFFLILVSSQDWLELSVGDVKNLLSSNYIRVNTEMEVFMSAIRWLRYDWSNRDKYRLEVLSCVRFGNVSPWQLVDIKRNPENPEFMEVARDPAITKLIDDGLAFVIIKYWYGQEREDFNKWNSVLGLQFPQPRNWSGVDKTYFTYREFLIYLDHYRRTQLIEKSKPKGGPESAGKKSSSLNAIMMQKQQEKMVPSMEDFLSKKKVTLNYQQPPTKLQDDVAPIVEDKAIKVVKAVQQPSTISIASTVGTESVMNKNILKMFTLSKQVIADKTKNQLSSSILPYRDKEYLTPTTLFLKDRETILLFGGIDPYQRYTSTLNSGANIYQYLPDTNTWLNVGEMPEPRHHHSVGFMRGRIYIAGGMDPRNDEIRGKSFIVNSVWSFDPVIRTWYSETPLIAHRRNFGLIVCNQKMYAIGGIGANGGTLASVERFDATMGVWEDMAAMKHARGGLACVKYRDWIWAAGGTKDTKYNVLVDAVECYNVKTNQWTSVTKLKRPKTFCSMFVLSDTLYVIGGVGHQFGPDKSLTSLGAMEYWDQEKLCWMSLPSMAVPRHSHTVGFIGTQIFVLGGVTTMYLKCLRNCECYCTKRKMWIRGIADLPTPLSGHAAITLPPASLISNL